MRFIYSSLLKAGVIFTAEVHCTSNEWEEWTSKQICNDFAPYEEGGITQEMLDQTMEWNQTWLNVAFHCPHEGMYRYRVVDSKIYQSAHYPWREFYGESAGKVLERMVKEYPVPDVDFIYLEWDSPPYQNHALFIAPDGSMPKGPIMVGSKGKEDRNLIFYHDWATMNFIEDPKYEHLSRTPFDFNYDWTYVSGKLRQECIPWGKRLNQLFWRGRITDLWDQMANDLSPRSFLCLLSQTNQQLIKASSLSAELQDHLLYKYQIAVDGRTAPYPGYIWRLLSNSLVFKQSSGAQQWFEAALIPYVHYIPVNHDLSDLVEKILWAQEHDEAAKRVAINARSFVLESAMPEHYIRYSYKVLLKYASLQRFKVQIPEKLIVKNRDPEYDSLSKFVVQLQRLNAPIHEQLKRNFSFQYDPSVYELVADPLTENEKIERRQILKQMSESLSE